MTEFRTVKAGEWVRPVEHGYLMECCGCALVHTVDFEVVGKSWWRVILLRVLAPSIVFRMFRDPAETDLRRRARGISVDNQAPAIAPLLGVAR